MIREIDSAHFLSACAAGGFRLFFGGPQQARTEFLAPECWRVGSGSCCPTGSHPQTPVAHQVVQGLVHRMTRDSPKARQKTPVERARRVLDREGWPGWGKPRSRPAVAYFRVLRATDRPRSASFLTPGQPPRGRGRLRKRKNRTIRTAAAFSKRRSARSLAERQRGPAAMWSRCSQKPFSLGATRNGECRERWI